VRKYRFLDEHRIGESESWFADMAARGLHLNSIGTLFAHFEQGESERMHYRIDFLFQALDKGDDVQRKLYSECDGNMYAHLKICASSAHRWIQTHQNPIPILPNMRSRFNGSDAGMPCLRVL